MRCKVGDLALIISSIIPENNGKLVRCIRLVDPDEFNFRTDLGPLWEIDTIVGTINGDRVPFIFDCRLMPIRPMPDEALEQPAERSVSV